MLQSPSKSGGDHEIRVAVIGVGSAASGMLQAASAYRQGIGLGILHPVMSTYSPSDIEVVAAYDVDSLKVGKTLSDAIHARPHSLRIHHSVRSEVKVEPGVFYGEFEDPELKIEASNPESVKKSIVGSGCDVVLNTINGGQPLAAKFYAEAAVAAGAAYVNATPDPVATSVELEHTFAKSGLPILGDDLLSQVGGTVLHSYMLWFLNSRGVKVRQTYQIDVGGGIENRITLSRDELRARKRAIKTMTVGSVVPYPVNVVSGTTEYVDFMGNERETHFEMVGESTLGAPLELEVTLKSVDGSNAAGPLLDAVRAAKIALDRGLGGAIEDVNPYLFKLIRSNIDPFTAEKKFIEFISGRTGQK
ncbi:MAG: hypothetical protein M1357_00800 [Candidatus Marsarchaeota archaeon]|nr:hypothetical protein [Candidatus Marsarchaeota archaeon]